MSRLQELLENRIKEFLKKRHKATSEEEIRNTIHSLNDFYWNKVSAIVEEHAPQKNETLDLSADERLLIDIGMIHRDLVGGDQVSLDGMKFELQLKSPSKNIFYLTQWLQYRWHFDSALTELKINQLTNQMGFRSDEKYVTHNEKRDVAFGRLKHIIVSMPGMNSKIFDTMKSGRLFQYLENAIYTHIIRNEEMSDEAQSMKRYFDKLLTQLRQRCVTKPLKDAWFEFASHHSKISLFVEGYAKERHSEIEVVENEIEASSISSLDHMNQNVTLLKSLINLGVMQNGTKRVFSPLFSDENRSTKTQVVRLLNLQSVVDPYLPGPPDILLAPYAGDGFFEWDRNTLILPITTESRLDITFANAMAKYRILTDALNFDNHLKESWEHAFGPGTFNDQFPEGYHNWIFGVGQGHSQAMGQWKLFKFFVDNIGPNPSVGIMPAELENMSPDQQVEEIKTCRAKINNGDVDFKTMHHMAALNWRRKNIPDAFEHMSQAHEMNEADLCVRFSLAYLSQQYNRADAEEKYRDIINNYPGTIWKVYSEIQLDSNKL